MTRRRGVAHRAEVGRAIDAKLGSAPFVTRIASNHACAFLSTRSCRQDGKSAGHHVCQWELSDIDPVHGRMNHLMATAVEILIVEDNASDLELTL